MRRKTKNFQRSNWLKRKLTKKNVSTIFGIAGVVLIGLVLLRSQAAVPGAVELESASRTGNTLVGSDANTSGGQYITLSPPDNGTCNGSQVTPGGDIQAVINAASQGATICVPPGIYRIANALQPKSNQKLIGASGAILNGSKVLSGWAPSGSNFVANSYPAPPEQLHGDCVTPGCNWTQDIFFDNQQFTRVMSMAELGPGKFYQDSSSGGKVYIRDNPAGHTVEQAVAYHTIYSNTATGVTIRGFIIEKAANRAQIGAITVNSPAGGWLIENNEIRYNHGVGVSAADGSIVRSNKIHHQGQMGVGGPGPNNLVENNEISYNNTAGYQCGWECGTSKWAHTDGLVVRGNYAHHNNGPGLWTDINNINTTYDSNVVIGNLGNTIFHEISYSGVIRNNISMDATPVCSPPFYCGGQILISASGGMGLEIYGNKIRGPMGIGLMQQNRGTGTFGPWLVQNVNVHDNDIHLPGTAGTAAGAVQDVGDTSIFTSRNNRFQNNHYHLPNLTGHFFGWQNADRTIAEWKGYGQDTTGTFDTNRDTAPPPTPSMGPAPLTASTATASVDISTAGTYRIWIRMQAPDQVNDSVLLQIDNGDPYFLGDKSISPNAWTWVDYKSSDPSFKANATLSSGSHTIKLTARETGVKIDKLIFVTDPHCVPSGTGENCAAGTVTPSPAYVAEDINQDGKINILDFSLLAAKFGQTANLGRTDINSDGVVNILDFSLLAVKFGT